MHGHLNFKVADEFNFCFLKGRFNCSSDYLFIYNSLDFNPDIFAV